MTNTPMTDTLLFYWLALVAAVVFTNLLAILLGVWLVKSDLLEGPARQSGEKGRK